MKTMTIIGCVVLVVVLLICFLFFGNTTIQFNPFKITIEKWWIPLGYLLMILGFCIYFVGEQKYYYKKGVKDTIETITKINKNELQ